MGQSLSKWKKRRGTDTLKELVPKKIPGHDAPLPNLNRNILMSAMNNVAKYIVKQGGNVTVIAVGGAVNTIYLQTRNATHDVDFFNTFLGPKEYELILNGAKEAVKKEKLLDEGWFNNRTVFFIPPDQRKSLSKEAFEQGEDSARDYDLDDAVEYLAKYLGIARVPTVSVQVVQTWFKQYSLKWTSSTTKVIAAVNAKFAKTQGLQGNVIV